MESEYVRPMDGSEIAVELGVTRQAVSNLLKRGMKKFYEQVKQIDSTWGPFECSCAMMKMFCISHSTEEIKKFYNLFPPSIRDEIEKDALENHVSTKFKEDYLSSK